MSSLTILYIIPSIIIFIVGIIRGIANQPKSALYVTISAETILLVSAWVIAAFLSMFSSWAIASVSAFTLSALIIHLYSLAWESKGVSTDISFLLAILVMVTLAISNLTQIAWNELALWVSVACLVSHAWSATVRTNALKRTHGYLEA